LRAGPSVLEYRALLLAGEGDTVAIGTHRSAVWEDHMTRVLDLDDVRVHRVERATGGNLAAAALEDGALLDLAVERASRAGRLNVRPYLSTDAAWRVAAEVADRSGAPVTVAGPPPPLAERVNDKLWFGRTARALLGRDATPPTGSADGLRELAAAIRELGAPDTKLAVKLTSAAAGQGNLVLPKTALSGSPDALRTMLRELLEALAWEDGFPLQVSVWEAPVRASPSVQTWIPRSSDPVVEGVLEQRFEGDAAAFAGVAPSTLPHATQQALARDATRMATLFQQLGYYGRCSFDAILVGPDTDDATIHWIECNGRWGGGSIPMTAAERIVGDWRSHPFASLCHEEKTDRRVDTDTAHRVLDELLLQPGSAAGVLLTSPTSLETGLGLDLLAVAGSRDEADRLVATARRRLLGEAA
ncbi:MAG: hypothetical protein R3314_12475, partial [Longimicrobiales bacterium]|nr:hypothetical protein [Longimicrobiales bacterium]